MPEQALYLKWRPLSFEDVIGQEHITRTLRNSLRSGRIRHAYLFSGPRGTGKTTTARLLAKAVNCTHEDADQRPCNTCHHCIAVNEGRFLDLIEIDAATHTGVDDVRDLRDKIAFTPGEGRYKVYIIDEVHRFTGNAFDALLKTLEEPPNHAIFVLATTEIDKVPQTIKSRCLQFEFRRVSLVEVADRLETITQAEGLNIDRPALELIARQGTGSVRDSISLLDQIVSDPEEVITLDIARRILGTASMQAVKDLVEALVTEDVGHGLHIINEAVDSGSDPRQFGQQIVEHLRAVLLAQTASTELVEASAEDHAIFTRQAGAFDRHRLLAAIRTFNEAVNDNRSGWQPQLSLELALIDSLQAPSQPQQTVIVQAQPTSQPEVEATAPGSPPAISIAALQAKWTEMLRALNARNKSAPAVVEHFHVHHVDGNLVYLSTDNDVFFRRLYGQPEKLAIVEHALYDTHQIPLRVQVMLAEGANVSQNDDDPVIMQALELGGQIKTDDKGDTDG